jgi:DNA-binding transcriptional regulator GbsR (MarR family)
MKTQAVVSTVMSSTRHDVNPENASRYLMIDADETREQTRKIHERQRLKDTPERLDEKTKEIPLIVQKHHAAQRLLAKRTIFNNFAKHMDYPDTLMRTRRDQYHFLNLIVAVCFVRQYQKESFTRDDGVEYIECDLDDYRIAYEIMMHAVLSSTMNELPSGSVALYDAIRALARKEARKVGIEPHEVNLTQRDIRESTGLGQSWIKQQLRILVDFEYVLIAHGGGARTKGYYRIRSDEPVGVLDFSMIPKPEEIERRLDEERSKDEHEK